MTWLIILFGIMLVISPVMWLKPSPRQRRVVGLRNQAMKAGVVVKLEKPPLHDIKTAMPVYRWRYPQHRPGPDFMLVRDDHASQALKPLSHGWRWRKEPLRPLPDAEEARLKALLSRLPLDALVVESGAYTLAMWWWESQDFARFSTYIGEFEAIRDGLAGRPDQPMPTSLGDRQE
ncbi:preprotein translocase subunit YajC [Halomonas urumqiensis]|uniref:Preprotein translocase subunit YajC n=1 Tax=Halomonas urumqiensis TaxID=1684789 RepID=A0A2N7UH42_9GAMM|nr:preprotein translocase subunit YajC [Halomonas urumqiensis]PMR79744.1 preprotein translocase subunit YajC [Halomonas urumqiensis]PTB00947.1 preprotein translocase subunit YajC [Halomonas urumqiensis]GHE22998.1 hypothetical protein GCM10017767_35190 [Halomonas urumqiensis]